MDYNSPEYQEYLSVKRAERRQRLADIKEEQSKPKPLEPETLPEPEPEPSPPSPSFTFMPQRDSGGSRP